jgi:hypothetical protein
MTDLVPSTLTDILAYLIPGLVLLAGMMLRISPSRFGDPQERLGVGELLIALLFAYLVGFIVYRLSKLLIFPLSWHFGEEVLDGIIRSFTELDQIRSSLLLSSGLTTSSASERPILRSVPIRSDCEHSSPCMKRSRMSRLRGGSV